MSASQSLRILLVEDDPMQCALTTRLLKIGLSDHVLRIAHRLSEAIRVLTEDRYDIVLLDLGLPDSIGVATLTRLHASAPAVPVIVFSALEDHETALESLHHGAHDYVLKDRINPEALTRIVRFAIERQKCMVFERELRTAEEVQARLFPSSPPCVPGLDIAGVAHSAGSACGDYFDFIDWSNGEIGLVVGDVSGHGMAAALRMVESRAYLRSLARRTTDLGGILTELNRFMIHESAYGRGGFQQFVTLFLAAINADDGTLRYASAGHSAYVVHQTGRTTRLDSTGVALGIIDAAVGAAARVVLREGDTLVIPTDGIEESMSDDGSTFGSDRLSALVHEHRCSSSSDILDRLSRAARSFAGDNPPQDDMTAIVVRVTALNRTLRVDPVGSRPAPLIRASDFSLPEAHGNPHAHELSLAFHG